MNAARKDPRVLLLTGDHGYALFDEIRRVCPDQYINAGVAEQNMVGVAAGLAKGGFRPVVYGLSAFVPVRVLEQIKMDVCYESLPVIFIGDGAGVVYSTLGTSHQSTEDVAAARGVPCLSILSPADAAEMTAAMELALRRRRPGLPAHGQVRPRHGAFVRSGPAMGPNDPRAGRRRTAGVAGDRLDGAHRAGRGAGVAGQRRLERPLHQAAGRRTRRRGVRPA